MIDAADYAADFKSVPESGFTEAQANTALSIMNIVHACGGFGTDANAVQQFEQIVGFQDYAPTHVTAVGTSGDRYVAQLAVPLEWLDGVAEETVRDRLLDRQIRKGLYEQMFAISVHNL